MNVLTNDQRFDQFITAAEGGSNYWYYLPDLSMCKKYRKGKDQTLCDLVWAAVLAGESIPVADKADTKTIIGQFNMAGIIKGEQLMHDQQPSHYEDMIDENGDAITGDVWFQYATLGELVYG